MTDRGITDVEANCFTDGQCHVARILQLHILRGLEALHIEFGAKS